MGEKQLFVYTSQSLVFNFFCVAICFKFIAVKRIYYHFSFWIICLALEVYIEFSWISFTYPKFGLLKQLLLAVSGESLLFTVKVPLVYASIYIIRKYSIAQSLKTAFLLGLLYVLSAFISHFLIIYVVFPYIYADITIRPFFSGRIINAFIDLIFVSGIAIAIQQYRYRTVLLEQEKNLIREKLAAELSFLKTQINPHFLFNTLNSLYALARKKSDLTADVVLKLAELFRFMLYEAAKSTIPLSQEIAIIDAYIELERIRYNERLSVTFVKETDDPFISITPLILLPFVENAFKHGASETHLNSFIHIKLVLKAGILFFTVENSKEDGATEVIEGIGLKNVRRQLELIYSDYYLVVKNESKSFKIDLTITLSSYGNL